MKQHCSCMLRLRFPSKDTTVGLKLVYRTRTIIMAAIIMIIINISWGFKDAEKNMNPKGKEQQEDGKKLNGFNF
jgi:hypothetical protein